MMLYHFNDKVHFSMGAQRIPQAQALLAEYKEPALQHILCYVFFSYGRNRENAYLGLPPVERRKSVIIEHSLFPETEKKDDFYLEIENWPKVGDFISRFMELHYTQLERQLVIIREKIEKYQNILANPDANSKEEKEADEMLVLFNKRAEELEAAIMKEEEFGMNAPAALHLFELPEEVKAAYRKMGFEF